MYNARRSFIKDISKPELLTMREGGMSNAEIASSLGCSTASVYSLIGAQPKEMTSINRQRGARARSNTTVQSSSVVAHSAPQAEQEPKKAVLAVKATPVLLSGGFMEYVVSADRKTVDVETREGRCLMQIPADKLDLFIKELSAIKANMNNTSPLQFWA